MAMRGEVPGIGTEILFLSGRPQKKIEVHSPAAGAPKIIPTYPYRRLKNL